MVRVRLAHLGTVIVALFFAFFSAFVAFAAAPEAQAAPPGDASAVASGDATAAASDNASAAASDNASVTAPSDASVPGPSDVPVVAPSDASTAASGETTAAAPSDASVAESSDVPVVAPASGDSAASEGAAPSAADTSANSGTIVLQDPDATTGLAANDQSQMVAVSGRVVSPNGNAVPGSSVEVWVWQDGGWYYCDDCSGGNVDDKGDFTVSSPAGSTVTFMAYPPYDSQLYAGWPDGLASAPTAGTGAGTIQIVNTPGGSQTVAAISLHAEAPVVTGRVVDGLGNPVAGYKMCASGDSADGDRNSVCDMTARDGLFSLTLPPSFNYGYHLSLGGLEQSAFFDPYSDVYDDMLWRWLNIGSQDVGDVVAFTSVDFDANGGDFDTYYTTVFVPLNGALSVLPHEPTRAGHTFVGWNTKQNGNGQNVTAATVITKDTTVYAQWTPGDNTSGDGQSTTPSNGGSNGSSGSGSGFTVPTGGTVVSSNPAPIAVSLSLLAGAIAAAVFIVRRSYGDGSCGSSR